MGNVTKFSEDFIKSYNEENDEGYFLEVDVQYFKKLHELLNDLPFLPERMKIEKLVANLHDKTEYFMQIANLKQALNHGLVFRKVHRLIKFNLNACLKPHIGINTDLRKKAKKNLKKGFFKVMNNSVFEKTMENVTKHRDIKLVTTEIKSNYLV